MALATLLKAPAETLHVQPAFRAGFSVAAFGAITVEAQGLTPGAPALVADELPLAEGSRVALSGGGDGELYLVRVIGVDADGAEEQAELEISVVDPAWSMPDGGAAYLTIRQFVDRWGYGETVRMTDASGSGRIDRTYLINALIDVQAEIDANLASRYALPLDPVPAIVERWMADLARGRLYPGGAPEGVSDAAKAATRQLERIASGAMALPGGASPSEMASETPILIAGGQRAYPDGLNGFLGGFR